MSTDIKGNTATHILILCFSSFFAMTGISVISPLIPEMKSFFQVSYANTGLIISAFGVARLIIDIPAGFLCDKISKKKLMISGILVLITGSIYAANSPTFFHIVTARIVMGIGSCLISTVALIWVLSLSSPDNRATYMSYNQSAHLTGSSIFPMVGGYLGRIYGWRAGFYFCAAAAAISLILISVFTREKIHAKSGADIGHSKKEKATLREFFFNNKSFLMLLALYYASFAIFFNRTGFRNTVIPLYGRDKLDLDPAYIGTVLTIAALTSLIVTMPGGILADKFGKKKILLPGLTLIALGNLSFLFASDFVKFILATMLLSTGAMGSAIPGAILVDIVHPSIQGRIIGIYRFIGDVGFIVGPIFLGTLLDYFGYSAAIFVTASTVFVAILVCAIFVESAPVQRSNCIEAGSLSKN